MMGPLKAILVKQVENEKCRSLRERLPQFTLFVLITGLEPCLSLGLKNVLIEGDSQLVVILLRGFKKVIARP
jgi:hypothetical protein